VVYWFSKSTSTEPFLTFKWIAVFVPLHLLPPNGLRYWRWGGRGLCLGAGKT